MSIMFISLTTSEHIMKIIDNEYVRVDSLYDNDISKYNHMLIYFKAIYDAKDISRDSYHYLIEDLDLRYEKKI